MAIFSVTIAAIGREGRNARVRIDAEIFRLLVLAFGDHDSNELELGAGFFQSDMRDQRAGAAANNRA